MREGPNPSGLCMCNCGARTPIATETKRGNVRGQPMRYVKGHKATPVDDGFCRCGCGGATPKGKRYLPGHRYRRDDLVPPNPSGLCWCGCGEQTPLAGQTDRRAGLVAGEHVRFIQGHNGHLARVDDEIEECNPTGLCLCGCGEVPPPAAATVREFGYVKGRPVRYVPGHRPASRLNDEDPFFTLNESGCWIWARSANELGYGWVRRDGQTLAHRWVYERLVGPIPKGYHLHHTCETPACVNPAHLEPLTPAEHRARHMVPA